MLLAEAERDVKCSTTWKWLARICLIWPRIKHTNLESCYELRAATLAMNPFITAFLKHFHQHSIRFSFYISLIAYVVDHVECRMYLYYDSRAMLSLHLPKNVGWVHRIFSYSLAGFSKSVRNWSMAVMPKTNLKLLWICNLREVGTSRCLC